INFCYALTYRHSRRFEEYLMKTHLNGCRSALKTLTFVALFLGTLFFISPAVAATEKLNPNVSAAPVQLAYYHHGIRNKSVYRPPIYRSQGRYHRGYDNRNYYRYYRHYRH